MYPLTAHKVSTVYWHWKYTKAYAQTKPIETKQPGLGAFNATQPAHCNRLDKCVRVGVCQSCELWSVGDWNDRQELCDTHQFDRLWCSADQRRHRRWRTVCSVSSLWLCVCPQRLRLVAWRRVRWSNNSAGPAPAFLHRPTSLDSRLLCATYTEWWCTMAISITPLQGGDRLHIDQLETV